VDGFGAGILVGETAGDYFDLDNGSSRDDVGYLVLV
jgi:hypothetical protein